MNWDLRVDKQVKKFLKRIPRSDARHIDAIIQELVFNPYAGDIEKMEGEEDVWRRRVGAYRVLYQVFTRPRIIHVAEVKRRTSKTY